MLHELLSENTSQKYLSPTLQNELIQVLGDKVKTDIVRDINDAMFYSMIFDTILDITKKDQLSTIIRYVTIPRDSSGKPTSLVINERVQSGGRSISRWIGRRNYLVFKRIIFHLLNADDRDMTAKLQCQELTLE